MQEYIQYISEAGGLFAWPILLLSIVGTVIFIERFHYLHKGHIHKHKFIAGVKTLVGKDRLVEALTLCEESPGPLTSVIRAALLHSDGSPGEIRQAIQAAGLSEVPLLERRIGGVALVANLGPFLGLLGTGFAALEILSRLNAEGPYMNSSAFAGDMGQALVSSVSGILLATIALVGHHILNGRVNAIVLDMEIVGTEIMQFLVDHNKPSDVIAHDSKGDAG